MKHPRVIASYSVDFRHHEHEVSGENWPGIVRRRASAWETASCLRLGIA